MNLEELLASATALPSIPKVLALLLNELGRDEPDLRKIAMLINTDPVLTARVLQLANSAQYQLAHQVSSVAEALAFLGLDQVRSLVSAAAVSGAFKRIPGVDMHQFWRYSLNVAKLSRTMAGMVKQNQSAAFTAGLIHAVGELVMHLGMPAQMEALNLQTPALDVRRAAMERRVLGFCYSRVSAGFARSWQFPQPIVDALEHQFAPFENGVYEPLAGVLHLSAWRARANEAGYDEEQLTDNFPDEVALALSLDMDAALQREPVNWTTPAEAVVMV